MTALSETAYPQLVGEPRPRELDQHYTPNDGEQAWAAENARTVLKRVGLLMLLKCAQRLGYFPMLHDVPPAYRDHITKTSGLLRPLSADDLKRLDADSTRHANITLCRERLGIRPIEKGSDWLLTVAKGAAQTKHQIADIVNVMLEELVHHRYELPGFTTVVRVAKSARDQVDEQHFASITDHLKPHGRRLIDDLFKRGAGSSTTGWNALKQEPGRPTNNMVREYLHHIRHLQKLAADMPKINIPVPKLRYYRTLARAQNAAEMAELKPSKRYALAVIYIRSCQGKALDDAADLFIRLFSSLENSAQRRLQEYRLDHQKLVDALVQRLHDTAIAYQADGDAQARLDAITAALGENSAAIVAQCVEHLAFAGNNHFPFMLTGYPALRSILFNCLEIMTPRSTSDERVMERMIDVLKALRPSRAEVVAPSELGLDSKRDLAWMSPQWRKLVFSVRSDSVVMYRKYFELSVLQQIRNELKGGDLFIHSGERYDDYREQLVDRTTFADKLDEYGEVTGLDVDPKEFV